MNWFDIVCGIILLAAFLGGMKKGFIMQMAKFAGILAAILFASKLAKIIMPTVTDLFSLSARTAPAVSYLASFILLVIIVMVVGKSMQSIFEKVYLGGLNKLLGGVFSVFTSILILSMVLNLILMVDKREKIIKHEIRQNAILYPTVKMVAPAVAPFLKKEVWQKYLPKQQQKEMVNDSIQTVSNSKNILI